MADLPRVAFIAGTLGRGGAERQLYYQLQALVAAGTQPVVASLSEAEHWEDRIRDLGVCVISFSRERSPLRRVDAVARALRPVRPDVVQSAHFYTNLYACSVARLLRAAEVGAIRSDARWAVGDLPHLGRASLTVPRHLAVNSLAAVQQAEDMGARSARLTYLPNVVDTDRFEVSERPPTQLRLLDVGRLIKIKRHDRFLRLVRAVVDAHPTLDVQATLVGEGPERDVLQALSHTLGLSDRVAFVEDGLMPRMYAEASLLVLTSEHEGTPNVVLEAMSTGLPVVAFDVGGVGEVITDPAAGILIPAADEPAMTAAVLELAIDPSRRGEIGRAARRHVEATRSLAALGARLDHLYTRVQPQRSRLRR